ncbi:YicC/YloC family endoribonuclease [Anianabacter salinae]|uniref:YicC/YloC family endoribonuclease n=1 Tax=Anianabacter salinae TaxID=2851023 RepID=UPI00225E2589|nr:YicC/YloC family endoribonuclease [Anianabacter salinae]MBV0912152.1 YicC family protein [Anianabacter salinae]
MTKSMTGFATRAGRHEGWSWSWDIRSVNGRGLDIRLRMPDWIEGLEQAVRKHVSQRAARGSVTVSLKLQRDAAADDSALDPEALTRALDRLRNVAEAAESAGVSIAPVTAADVLALPGVMRGNAEERDMGGLAKAVLADLAPLMDAFDAARDAEGTALADVIGAQIARIAELTAHSAQLADERRGAQAETLRTNMAKVMDSADKVDPGRLEQELALLVVKSDVTEEIDRLGAHVEAARVLLAEDGPIGRKFDFLTQEFNREANTLCSKAGSAELTRTGLDLKTVIDQMREQVQNVE